MCNNKSSLTDGAEIFLLPECYNDRIFSQNLYPNEPAIIMSMKITGKV